MGTTVSRSLSSISSASSTSIKVCQVLNHFCRRNPPDRQEGPGALLEVVSLEDGLERCTTAFTFPNRCTNSCVIVSHTWPGESVSWRFESLYSNNTWIFVVITAFVFVSALTCAGAWLATTAARDHQRRSSSIARASRPKSRAQTKVWARDYRIIHSNFFGVGGG